MNSAAATNLLTIPLGVGVIASGAGALRRVGSPAGGTQDVLQQLRDLRVVQSIVDELAVLAVCNSPGFSEHPQLLGDVGLWPPQHRLEVADTRLVAPQFVQNPQTGWMREDLEQLDSFVARFFHFTSSYALEDICSTVHIIPHTTTSVKMTFCHQAEVVAVSWNSRVS